MTINTIFSIVGCALLGAGIALVINLFKHYDGRMEADVWWIAAASCICLGIACIVIPYTARECPTCDIIVPGNYCEECGLQVRDLDYPDNFFCSVCGDEISDKANFCGHCGAKVDPR